MVQSAPSSASAAENRFLIWIFVAALLFHAWGASVGWKNLNLPGCEFRQAQTAISAFFIQRENNFSLAYPTPVLGKPWSIPMEFPLYQWTVVKVSNWTGLPLTQSGRLVSVVCFYAGLPALYLLLARFGLSRPRRLMLLGLVLCCPLYIYYARAFLIETMAWMFGLWFLLGYVHGVERCRVGWMAVGALAGIGSGLVKVTTLLFFLLPAFAWTIGWYWRQRRDLRALGWLTLRCAAVVALPFAASVWWVGYSDAIKALSPAGSFLQSAGMHGYNFGIGVRFDPGLWKQHWAVFVQDLAVAPVLGAMLLVAVVFARRWWPMIGALVFFFFAVQVIFPILYAWHEYYYVANAFMLMLAFGFALLGVLDSRLPRWAAWSLTAGLFAAQGGTYLAHHYPGQRLFTEGGSSLTMGLRFVTDPDDVVVNAGEDWSSITPYFTQRRSLMIRRSLETTWDVIVPAFDALRDEEVTALVLFREQRENRALLELAVERFQLDPRVAFSWKSGDTEADVYLHRQLRPVALERLRQRGIAGLEFPTRPDERGDGILGREVSLSEILPRFRRIFAQMSPLPARFYTTFGLDPNEFADRTWVSAHPDTHLWFDVAAGRREVRVEVGLFPEAYGDSVPHHERSDGFTIELAYLPADGNPVVLFTRHFNPRDHQDERGLLLVEHAFDAAAPGQLRLSVLPGPHGNYARDWAMLGPVVIR